DDEKKSPYRKNTETENRYDLEEKIPN
ncbi:MAG: hypothetical protein ACJAVF_004523, partial [Paraglaciecola sp.]